MITALQHVGIAVQDPEASFRFFHDMLGFKLRTGDEVFNLDGGGVVISHPSRFRVVLGMNPRGGAMVELIENQTSPWQARAVPSSWAAPGIVEIGITTWDLETVFRELARRGVFFLTPILRLPWSSASQERFAYIEGPEGLLIRLTDHGTDAPPGTGGIQDVTIHVKEMSRARAFYERILGFTIVAGEFQGKIQGMEPVAGPGEFHVVALEHPQHRKPHFSHFPPATIRLVQVTSPPRLSKPIQEDRAETAREDIHAGILEVALDVIDHRETEETLRRRGGEWLRPFSEVRRDNVTHFAYMRDPEGTLVEFVEIEKTRGIPARWAGLVSHCGLATYQVLRRLRHRRRP